MELGALIPGPELCGPEEPGAEGPNDIRGSEPLGGARLLPRETGRSIRGPPGGRPGIPGGRPPGN